MPKKDGVSDFWDASFLAQFPENEPKSFFDAPKDELRLVFMVHHDFFNPYMNKTSGKKRSIGMVMMVCLNLPPDIRYNRENVYLVAVIPGPSLPGEDRLNHFLRPIVDNLKEHFDPGVWIARTAKYPRGRKVRSAAPIISMDVPASRDWGGLGSHSHTILCSFCLIIQAYIDVFRPGAFPNRTIEQHRQFVELWNSASTPKARAQIWANHAARHSEWLRFPWWNVITETTFAPMHWTKNILEKQLRENMGWSWTTPAGVPEPTRLKAISVLEADWGRLAMQYSSSEELQLPELVLRHLCRQYMIFETGLPSSRMTEDLNRLRINQGVINANGAVINPAPRLFVEGRQNAASAANVVTLARAEAFLSRATRPSLVVNNSSLDDLLLLCDKFKLPYHLFNTKPQLAVKLIAHYKSVKVAMVGENDPPPPKPLSWLGAEVLREVKEDMEATCIPSWLKTPPKNFATVSHVHPSSITIVSTWRTSKDYIPPVP
ncbi:hypothetical protein FRC09_016908 [Ceratobasidium sp. 395]|nr:hypothetical protein FRC09_016908 [Ceratobasidium sp. 395]